MVLQRADNIRPYVLGVKYKILRDVQEAVPYAVILYYNLLEKFQFYKRSKFTTNITRYCKKSSL